MAHLADALKEKGNSAFREGLLKEADEYYTQAIQKYSRNPLIFTNRANARLRLQLWDEAVNDCLKSIEITQQNHKAYYFLGEINPKMALQWQVISARWMSTEQDTAQAQLALNHPNEALSSALTAYEQVRFPAPAVKTSPKDLETFSAFVLKCKKAKFAVRDRERLRRQGDLAAELEELLERRKTKELTSITNDLQRLRLGNVEAQERKKEIELNYEDKINELKTVFMLADPANHTPREIPDHVVDMITFEPMHDPVMTRNGHSYERATIYEHLKRSPTDPLTREPLTIDELRPNYGLKAACDAFWEGGASDWITDW